MQIDGSVVAVTGAANGIGQAIALAAASHGASAVAILDLDEAGTERVSAEIAAGGTASHAYVVDVSSALEIEGILARVEEDLGPIDVMVSNAGVGTGAGVDAGPDDWERSWNVNVMAHVHAARTLLPSMLERGHGAFVHTCSAAGLLTMIGDAPYSVSKHAAVAFAEWLAVTYGGRGIQISALCPQGVETELLRTGAGEVAEEVVRRAGAVLSPEAVAEVVIEAVEEGRFLVLPHPEVADHFRRKAEDPQRWIGSMQRFASQINRGR